MYNRTRFNHTAYNRTLSVAYQWTAVVSGSTETQAHCNLSIVFSAEKATAESFATGTCRIVVFPSSVAEVTTEAIADYMKTIFFQSLAEVITEANGTTVSIYELSLLLIEKINMVAGDMLVIDTEHMTVTLNGINVVDKIVDDSIFFDLKPGLNQISVESVGSASTAEIKIIWKDRWL